MKHFLGSCQQNRHLRQRQTERETGRERGREREKGPPSGPVTWRWEALAGRSADAGQPRHALGTRLGCQGAACTGQRRAGPGSRVSLEVRAQALTGQERALSPCRAHPHWPWGTRGLHAALWPHSTRSRPGAAVGTPQSRTQVLWCTVKAAGLVHFKSPCHTQNTHHTSLSRNQPCATSGPIHK